MGFHHLAVATRNIVEIDRFYSEAMGFNLVRVEVAQTPEGGWAKHFFYDTGDGELMAFWEIHDDALPSDFPTSLSEAAGLPGWTNHYAFRAKDRVDLEARLETWLATGHDTVEIDHNWCQSIYTADPNGTTVEWCLTTREFDDSDGFRAREALARDDLPFDEPSTVQFHKAPTKSDAP